MTGTPNPPIPGHHLLFEGAIRRMWDVAEEGRYAGGCQCGERPPNFPNLSAHAMKAWHRVHKAAIREVAQ